MFVDIVRRLISAKSWKIFWRFKKKNSGTPTVKEFQEVLNDINERYPQVELYLKNKQMPSIVDLLKYSKGNVAKESIELNIKNSKQLSQVDYQNKNLPATAQAINDNDIHNLVIS